MKKSLLLLFVLLLFSSCNSVKKTQQALNSGNYIQAINTSIAQLQKNKTSNKSGVYASLLKESFEKYRESTLDRISFLERDAMKDNSKPVYESYVSLQNIQNRIKPLLPLQNDQDEIISFDFYDFTENILVEKENYANYLYTKANDLLRTKDKIDSRVAYNSFVELEKLAPQFRDVSALKREAYLNGIDFILVSLYNDTEQVIPEQVEDRLLNFSTLNLDDLWTEYHMNKREDVLYDSSIEINFTSIQFSPERLVERQIPLEREIVDGWRYKKDRNGNFILDDRGNKIKEDIIVKASGTLFETVQSKEVKVVAEVNYFDLIRDQKTNSYPLESVFVFENRFADFEGNQNILTKDEQFLLRGRPVDYPSNEMMITDASEDIKAKLKSILKQQRSN